MKTLPTFLLAAAAAPLAAQDLVLDRSDFNYAVGVDTDFHYYANLDLAGSGILPFNAAQGHWDFSSFNGGSIADVTIVDKTTTPYASSFPNAVAASKQDIPGNPTAYYYEYQTATADVAEGFGTSQLGITIKAQFNPDWQIFRFPMGVGQTSTQTFKWSYKVLIVTVTVTETHSAEVVAEGSCRVPGFAYDMPCLVEKEFVTISDTVGSSDNYDGYYWLVANGFTGGNGVVALQSNTNGGPQFTVCRNAFFLGASNVTPDAVTLRADAASISQSAGGAVNFSIDAGPAYAGRQYLLAGSASGTYPGTVLPGGAILPLNQDAVTSFLLANANSALLPDWRGALDGLGRATPRIDSPGPLPPAALGLHLNFAFTTESPYDFQSNTVFLDVTP